MTDEEILHLAEENQRKARKVIEKTGVINLWKESDAEINLVGSLAMGLLMTHRDIDFHIYTPNLDISNSFATIAKLAEVPGIVRISYNNLLQEKDACLKWHAWYHDDENQEWQLDMMHIRRGSAFDGYFEQVAATICHPITPEQKLTVLRLKYETPEAEKIAGIEYYRAVMGGGVKNFQEFWRWRKENPLQGISTWQP